MENEVQKEIVKRLDTIIGLLIENLVVNGLAGKSRTVELLSQTGLKSIEISKILDMTTNNVNAVLSNQKKQKAKKKSRKQTT